MSVGTQQRVLGLLRKMPSQGLDAAKELFWRTLHYARANEQLSRRSWPERAQASLAEPPLLLANAGDAGFEILYARLAEGEVGRGSPLSLTAERLVINQLLHDHPYALFLFSDAARQNWHLVNVRDQVQRAPSDGTSEKRVRRRILRRISVGPHERLRTAAERVALLDVESISGDLFGLSALKVQARHDEAFDVEAVTKDFFKNYDAVFRNLRDDLDGQTGDAKWAHDYALQFLNRLMFLYYVQRKRWLGDDPDFLGNFWRAYHRRRSDDTFVSDWLNVLFFEAFNDQFQGERTDRQYLPEGIRNALTMAPYLNGGLFERNDLDRAYAVSIADTRFEAIHRFLERYNFTISEDTPLDQEVAVDPEMIGKVYESLVNVSDDVDEQGEAGIYYTPRVEIDLMCRLSLVDWLSNHLGSEFKPSVLRELLRPLLYETVFAFDPEDIEEANEKLSARNLWPRLAELLREVTVLDPACGSGSFLVGMLYVLDDLVARANAHLGIDERPYDRKKRIVGRSLYGVDVKEWAVHVAELRLWLQLLIDTEIDPAELQFQPVLPNLSFKIRPGDSLVQEVGGINLAMRKGSGQIPPHLKGRITQLKADKRNYYNNKSQAKSRIEGQLRHAELALFRDILDARIKAIGERLKEVEAVLRPQENLFGEVTEPQMRLERVAHEREQAQLKTERDQLVRARGALRSTADIPFVWDIAFVEVFKGERAGFDIVIGNPPYVRQESIRDPHQPDAEVTPESKKAYKTRLANSVYAAWSHSFGYDWGKGKPRWKLAARSDLYIYFYLHGLSLLDEKGSFCFITSNAWLDVGYGADLQRFLLTRGKVKLVVDNEVRRSFATADVNTVIVLLGAPSDTRGDRQESLKHTARFVMLTVPYEETLHPVIWEEIEEATARGAKPEYRVHPRRQQALLESGMDPQKDRYAGDKWGGKYLRAPDIYWTILEKGKDKLVRLGDIAEVRRGFTTGANAFFYLNEERIARWGIEEEFLRPVIKSPRECKSIVIDPKDLKYKLFMCHKEKGELRGTAALDYIEWGETQGFHERPSCRGRRRWWDLGQREGATVNCNYLVDRVMRFFGSHRPFYVSDNFQEVHVSFDPMSLCIACNSMIAQLHINITGRSNFGDGLLKIQTYEVSDILIPKPQSLVVSKAERMMSTMGRLDLDGDDRRILDTISFDSLGLTQGERDAVYEAVIHLVEARLSKARSLKRSK